MAASGDPRTSDPAPDLQGYLAAVGISWLLIVNGLCLVSLWTSWQEFEPNLLDDLIGYLVTAVPVAYIAAICAAFTAPPGVFLVHGVSRIFPQQWVQLLATSIVGVLSTYWAAVVFGENPRDWDKVAVGVGICTALGRAAVIPMVPAVHQMRAPGTTWWRTYTLR